MADRRRIVTLSPGGRPIVELDLEVAATYMALRGTFQHTPGSANTQSSREPGRYGGSRTTGEQVDNGTVSWSAFVQGSTPSHVATNIEAMLTSVALTSWGRLLEWRPDGSSFSSYFDIAGPGTYKLTYDWAMYQGAQAMQVDISFPVRPLVNWDQMTIGDPFDVDSSGDYTFDAGAGTAPYVTNAISASSTAEKRLYHSARGYTYGDYRAQLEILFSTPANSAAARLGVIGKRLDASNYLAGVVRYDGLLMIVKVDAGVATTLASTAITVTAATVRYVSLRQAGNVLTVEYWTSEPTLNGVPDVALSATLAGGDATKFGTGIVGQCGVWWIPQTTTEFFTQFKVQPYHYNVTAPAKIALRGPIPGSAPALVNIRTGVTTAIQFALFGWDKHGGGASAPVGVFDSSTATLTGGGLSGTGGESTATTSGAATYSAYWTLDLSDVDADEFAGQRVDLEVWARVIVASTVVNPTFRAEIRPFGPTGPLAAVGILSSQEFQSPGKSIVKPSSGTVRRFVRLGTIPVSNYVGQSPSPALMIVGTVAAGSTGTFGFADVVVVPARRRACSPTGVPGDSTYPTFRPTGTDVFKTIRSDLSGLLGVSHYTPQDDHGLGGTLITIPPGARDLVVKLSDLVPDDPTVDTTTETASFASTVFQLDVTPRSYLLRGA